MSLNAKILNLLKGIDDPALRVEIAQTIRFLFEVYMSSDVEAQEIKNSLKELALTIINMKEPLLTEAEKRKKAEEIANDLWNTFKAEALFMVRFRRFRHRMIV